MSWRGALAGVQIGPINWESTQGRGSATVACSSAISRVLRNGTRLVPCVQIGRAAQLQRSTDMNQRTERRKRRFIPLSIVLLLAVGAVVGTTAGPASAVTMSGPKLLTVVWGGYCFDGVPYVRQWYCNFGRTQQWNFEPTVGDGFHLIRNRSTGTCLDVADGSYVPGPP